MLAETVRNKRKLLDLSAYSSPNEEFNVDGLIRDTAHAFIEIDTSKPIEERTFRVLMAVVGEDKVINWPVNKTKDVKNQYSIKNELDRRETAGGLAIREFLLSGEEGDIFAQVSPPSRSYDYYEEGRFQVGVIRKKMGFKILQQHGIPMKCTPEESIDLFEWLQEFATKEPNNILDPEDLRDKILKISAPDQVHWLEFMQKAVPELAPVWEAIKDGRVAKKYRETIRDTREEVEKIKPHITNQSRPVNYVYEGARLEQGMHERGYNLKNSECGYSNSYILRLTMGQTMLSVSIVDGKMSIEVVEIVCCTCPFCKKEVSAQVYGGRIHCPECGESASWGS